MSHVTGDTGFSTDGALLPLHWSGAALDGDGGGAGVMGDGDGDEVGCC